MDCLKKKFETVSKILELSFSLANTNFKLRNEGSILGIFWYLLNPLSIFAIMLLIKKLAFSSVHIPYYQIYLIMGLTLFNFFSHTIGASINIIKSNAGMIKSSNIPLEPLIISRVIQSVYSHIFELILIIGFMIYFKAHLIGILYYPFVFIFFMIFVLGVSFLVSTIGVYINDLNNIWPIISQILFFISPIFYVITPGTAIYTLNYFNPLFYFMTVIRDLSLYDKIPPVLMLSFTAVMSIVSLYVGLFVFQWKKKKFAENI